MSTLERFLSEHGLLALFLVALVEGDASLVLAGVLAHAGVLPLGGVVLAGTLGNLVGDSAWFTTGRWLRSRLRNWRLFRAVGPRVERLAARLGPWQLLTARLIYGTRNVSMLFWGQHGLDLRRFLLIDALGCFVAACGFSVLGYLVGRGTGAVVGEVNRVEHWLLGGVVLAVLVAWGVSRLARRRLELE
jgi:membrane protein DedA with SNARE-associated domain